jgi:hypothetical protein
VDVTGENEWEKFTPKFVSAEDSMSPKDVAMVWQRIYKAAGANGEDAQKAVRVAVYVYGRVNGTSRAGNYQGECVPSTGSSFPAAAIPQATGSLVIRRFYRGNMAESYQALKHTGWLVNHPRVLAGAARLGVGPSEAFAMADWMKDCQYFTPAETRAFEASFTTGIERATRARGGQSLEQVEAEGTRETMEAQGPKQEAAVPGRRLF